MQLLERLVGGCKHTDAEAEGGEWTGRSEAEWVWIGGLKKVAGSNSGWL